MWCVSVISVVSVLFASFTIASERVQLTGVQQFDQALLCQRPHPVADNARGKGGAREGEERAETPIRYLTHVDLL